MLFPSLAFLVFLPLVFLVYWYVVGRSLRVQNAFVLLASYVFYGWWDWRFLGLLFASSIVDYFLGIALEGTSNARRRRAWVGVSLVVNLGLLGAFKYFNFFVGGMQEVLLAVGLQPNLPSLHILLPVGISFYTFQSLSYTIDVYRGQIKPTRDPIAFLAFVAFFPQLVAGPIERAANLLPQFLNARRFDLHLAKDGVRQMLWGFFKKIVVADTCAPLVNEIFAMDPASTPGITLFFGAFFFAFQIYGDFSGYSDIAIGCARLFGFELSRNFAYPYFARSISEFWRRWHISLSTWLRDYVYLSLGGWRTKWGRFRNILITFSISGFWHGANWTFLSWGVLHGAYYAPEIVRGGKARRDDAELRDLPHMIITFLLVVVAWVFFRAPTVEAAWLHVAYMFGNLLTAPGLVLHYAVSMEMAWILLLLFAEWSARRQQHALAALPKDRMLRWAIYYAVVLALLMHTGTGNTREFIYFQF